MTPVNPQSEPDADDVLVFAEEESDGVVLSQADAWLVLIVDDEEEVHRLTRFVLADFTFEERPVTFLSAYSAAEAESVLRDHPEVAVILLDVVMEREDAGLQLVRIIREDMANREVRIILRTGQPGQAPESEVVARYDINDYKCKGDLTAQQLHNTLLVSLRDYRDIRTVVRSREGMQQILTAGGKLFSQQQVEGFTDCVLGELVGLLSRSQDCQGVHGLVARLEGREYRVRSVLGGNGEHLGRPVSEVLPSGARQLLPRVLREKDGVFHADGYLAILAADDEPGYLLHVGWTRLTGSTDRDLIRIFMANSALAYRNLALRQEVIDTQKEIIHTLSEVVETRSSETANHVLRVGLLAARLGELCGLSAPEVDVLRMVAPMHDVGKVGIPDAILNKPGRLDAAERRLIEGHTLIGHSILSRSERRIMKAAAVVALQHHERWDGDGYPNGLEGEAIHIHARITALADVFDALSQNRVYRRAIAHDTVLEMLARDGGRAFDPELLKLLLANHEEFRAIREAHPDRLPGDNARQARSS